MQPQSASLGDLQPIENADTAYRAAMDFIYQRLNYERVAHDSYQVEDFRLARMARFLELLGHPERKIPVVHVAGTKGKGSTSAMLASILTAAGLKVGLFTSPHLVRFEERMTVDGQEPSASEVIQLVESVRSAVERLAVEMPPGPTFFEMATALGWMHFFRSGCDIAVLEVGLGGRLDSTNLCHPECCIITSISRDHMKLLGETLPEIAAEKAGIIKDGIPVVTGVDQPEVLQVVDEFARRHGAPLSRLDHEIQIDSLTEVRSRGSLPRFRVDVRTPQRHHAGLITPLPGRHQARNLALAVAAFDVLSSRWRALDRGAISRGLSRVHWPFRIEQVASDPRIIIDTAHNDASMAALCETLAALPDAPRVLVFATSRDKEAAVMLRILNSQFDQAVLTRYIHNPRALPIPQLQELALNHLTIPVHLADDPAAALGLARALAGPCGMICITGSVFLAAEMQIVLRSGS